MIRSCEKCGGLYATENMEMFAGTPCVCGAPRKESVAPPEIRSTDWLGSGGKGVHLCPVCCGRGIVPNGFYSGTERQYSTTSTTPETCRACGGRGIIVT